MDEGLKITILNNDNVVIDAGSGRKPVYIEDNSDGSIHDLVAPLLDWWNKE